MEDAIEEMVCSHCNHTLKVQSKFCKHCGWAIEEDDGSVGGQSQTVTLLIIFYVLEVIICCLVSFNDAFHGLNTLLIVDSIMAAYAVFFFASIWKDVRHLLSFHTFSVKNALVYLGITIVFSAVVQVSVTWLNKSLFNDDLYYYFAFANYKHPLIFMIAVVALSPALFEELAYRGFVLSGLMKILDSRQALFISSFLFALIHLSLLSFFWLLPFALFLGYIRQKENTIWYGVLVHFVFNSLTCLVEYYTLFS